jgi:hypothetical protein
VGSTSAVDVNLRPRFVTPDHKEFKFKASANWVDVRMISRVRFRPRINIPFAVNIQPQKLELVLSSKKFGYASSRASDGPDGPGPDLPTDLRSEASASYPFALIPHPCPRPFPPLAASSPHSFPLPCLAVAIAVALPVALRYRSRCCSLGQTLGSHPYRCRRSCSDARLASISLPPFLFALPPSILLLLRPP